MSYVKPYNFLSFYFSNRHLLKIQMSNFLYCGMFGWFYLLPFCFDLALQKRCFQLKRNALNYCGETSMLWLLHPIISMLFLTIKITTIIFFNAHNCFTNLWQWKFYLQPIIFFKTTYWTIPNQNIQKGT